MKNTARKRMTSLMLSAVFTLTFFTGFPGTELAAYASEPEVNISIGINDQLTSADKSDALLKALFDALAARGYGQRAIAAMGLSSETGSTSEEHTVGGGGKIGIDAVDMSNWIVADHYDSGYYYSTYGGGIAGTNYRYDPEYTTGTDAFRTTVDKWLDIFAPASGKNFGGLNGKDNSSFRPYYPHAQPGQASGHASTGTFNDNVIPAAAQIMKLETWIGSKLTSGHGSGAPTVGAFDRHIYSREVSGKPTMDFVGYANSRYVDFAFYPVDTDPKMRDYKVKDEESGEIIGTIDLYRAPKLVSFDVDSRNVNAHTLFGAGYLINVGIAPTTGYISGYYLAYVYPDVGTGNIAVGAIPPTALVLYKIKDNVTVQAFHDHMMGSATIDAASMPVIGTTTTGAIFDTPIAVIDLGLYEYKSGTSGSGSSLANTYADVNSSYYTGTAATGTTPYKDGVGGTQPGTGVAVGTLRQKSDANKAKYWYETMTIEIVIEPKADGSKTALTIYQVEQGNVILHDQNLFKDDGVTVNPNYGLPTGQAIKKEFAGNYTKAQIENPKTVFTASHLMDISPFAVFSDDSAAQAKAQKYSAGALNSLNYNGFGPAVSYRSHGCFRATQFTFSNIDMGILGSAFSNIESKGPEVTLSENTLIANLKLFYEGGWVPKVVDGKYVKAPAGAVNNDEDIQNGYVYEWVNPTYDNEEVKYFIDLTDGDLPDRILPSAALWASLDKEEQDKAKYGGTYAGWEKYWLDKYKEAVAYIEKENINYITISNNAILTDGGIAAPAGVTRVAVGGEPTEGKNGMTIRGDIALIAGVLGDIAKGIVADLSLCEDGINYLSDDIVVFGFDAGRDENGKWVESTKSKDYYAGLVAYETAGAMYPFALEPDSGKTNLSDKDAWMINLTQETFTQKSGFNIEAYSLDGGKTWKKAKADTFSPQKFPKLLNKNTRLWLADKWNAKDEKDPETKKVVVKKGVAPDANVVTFYAINKRPKIDKYAVNYGIYADLTGETSGEWALSTKADLTKALSELTKDDAAGVRAAAIKQGLEIAVAVDKKTPGPFGTFCKEDGIPVKPFEGKVVKTTYFVKKAPEYKISGSAVSYTASSKWKKINVSSEIKPTKYKAKVTAEKKKTDKKTGVESVVKPAETTIKLKAGDSIYIGSYSDGFDAAKPGTATPLSADGKAAANGFMTVTSAKGSVISLKDVAGDITVWKLPTGKKPASAKQVISVEKTADSTAPPAEPATPDL